jgi:hypothetical protein
MKEEGTRMAKTERRVATEERRMISFDVTPEEERMISEAAKKDGMSRAAWIRSACYGEAIMSGNLEAVRLLGIRGRAKLVEWLKGKGLLPLGSGALGKERG